MPESNKPFVVTDRRKFTKEGELRPDAPHSVADASEPIDRASAAAPSGAPAPAVNTPPPAASAPSAPTTLFQRDEPAEPEPAEFDDPGLPAPTPEQAEQARFAYEATADRLETAIRAANPGADHPPAMNFEQLVQSFYLTAIMQLGGATQEGEKPRVDILGARQSIDMLVVLAEKSRGNLNPQETRLLDSALFELRMAFLEITQALTRSAGAQGGPGRPGPGSRPDLVL